MDIVNNATALSITYFTELYVFILVFIHLTTFGLLLICLMGKRIVKGRWK